MMEWLSQRIGKLEAVVFSGGVASNSLLRESTKRFHPIFSQPQYSTDNAMGVAILANRLK